MTKTKIFLLFTFLLVITPIVLSQPSPIPFQEVGIPGQVSYIIENPKLDVAYVGNGFYINSHVLFSNGTHILKIENTTEVVCEIDGFSRFGELLIHELMIPSNISLDIYSIYIPKEFFNNTGLGYYNIHCENINTGVSGLSSNPFLIELLSNNDRNFYIDLNDKNTKFILGIFVIISIIFLILGMFTYGGFGLFITGIVLMFSEINFLLSGLIWLSGLFIAFFGMKK